MSLGNLILAEGGYKYDQKTLVALVAAVVVVPVARLECLLCAPASCSWLASLQVCLCLTSSLLLFLCLLVH